jgi:putative FmdB family regulatory protein
MPIFEYVCEGCGNSFEKLVRRAEDTTECPSCGNANITQKYSTFAARSQGSAKESAMPSCPSGMCSNPGFCGRN